MDESEVVPYTRKIEVQAWDLAHYAGEFWRPRARDAIQAALLAAYAAGQASMRERAAQHLDAVARDCSAARRGLPEAAADHIRHLPLEETDA